MAIALIIGLIITGIIIARSNVFDKNKKVRKITKFFELPSTRL